MKDKIREIVKEELKRYKICEDKELSSTFASLIAHKIIEITRLDEEKVANAIHKSDHPEYKDCVDCKNARYFAETICSKQDELTKEGWDGHIWERIRKYYKQIQ